MISLSNVSHRIGCGDQNRWLLNQQDLSIGDRERIGIFARKGSGKSVLARLLCGVDRPHFGQILNRGGTGWPVGSAGMIHQHLTVAQNLSVVAKLATADTREAVGRFRSLVGSDLRLDAHARDLSPSDRALFAYGLSMMVPRQHYIVDEKVTFGTRRQREHQDKFLSSCLNTTGLVLISTNKRLLANYCYRFLELGAGQLVTRSHSEIMSTELEDV